MSIIFVAPSVIEAGGMIISSAIDALFGTNRMEEYLKQIIGQLNRVEELLEDIRQGLADMKVFIDQKFVEDAEKKLIARIRSYSEIASTLSDPSLALETRQELARSYLLEVQIARNTLCAYS